MIETLINASGGLGLFLVGMIVMTDGLRGLAGDSMRLALMRFTRSPVSGAVTGAIATAVLQSSSATTVAAVGFVGAGLLGFAEALGIIFGANIGTTITGWLVALLGFKLKLGIVVLPLILVGALMRLFGKGRVAHSGTALAGFGLIFVGIGLMQTGMAGLQDVITPAQLPQDTWGGRLSLVALGILITIIGLTYASLLEGSVLTETIFAWPGVGPWTVEAISCNDIPVVQAGPAAPGEL